MKKVIYTIVVATAVASLSVEGMMPVPPVSDYEYTPGRSGTGCSNRNNQHSRGIAQARNEDLTEDSDRDPFAVPEEQQKIVVDAVRQQIDERGVPPELYEQEAFATQYMYFGRPQEKNHLLTKREIPENDSVAQPSISQTGGDGNSVLPADDEKHFGCLDIVLSCLKWIVGKED